MPNKCLTQGTNYVLVRIYIYIYNKAHLDSCEKYTFYAVKSQIIHECFT